MTETNWHGWRPIEELSEGLTESENFIVGWWEREIPIGDGEEGWTWSYTAGEIDPIVGGWQCVITRARIAPTHFLEIKLPERGE